MLRLKSLGQTLIEVDDARLTPAAETVFATALYLIVEAGRRVEREELTCLLWPGVSEAQAQHGLRQVLYRLKTLGATIKADRSSLILAPRFCTTDFEMLLEPQTPTSLEALADRIEGSFLPGYRPELSADFTSWVDRQRDIVHSAITRALVAGIQAKKRISDWTGAEHLAAMCLTIDPLNEEATLTVAEAAALGGSKTRALSILTHYLEDIGENAGEIRLPAALLRRRISEAYEDNIFPVRDAPFVGREEEMAELTRALARAQGGQGSAYVIWGEPGIGKTRLVSEFTRVASLQRVQIVRVACQSHDVRRPLSAFVEMVPKLLALPGALGCSPESMKYLRRLTTSDEGARGGEDIEASATGIFEHVRAAVLDLIDAVASEYCLIVHLEDVQWLDQYSQSVCKSISELSAKHRLMLVTTLAIDTHREETFDRHILSLHLKPLSESASSALVDYSLSHHDSRSQSFKDWCVRAGCGNPYFLSELLTHAKDDGTFRAPPSLSRLIDARLSSLTLLSQRVLQASCILGRHSSLKAIEKVLNERRIQLLDSLDELAARGFVEHEGDRVTSRHTLITVASLARASTASKAIMHRYAALALEEESLETATPLWDCAEHWRRAGDLSRAASLMGACARHSLKIGLPLEAASVLETAAQLAIGEDQVTYLRDCAAAFAVAGSWEKSRHYSERTIEAMNRTSASVEALAEAELKLLVTGARIRGLTPEVLGRLEDLVSSPRLGAAHRYDAALVALMEADNTRDGELAKSLYCATQGIDAKEDHIPQRDHFLLIYHTSFGDARDAIPAIERLLCFARENKDLVTRAMYFEHAGHAYTTAGDIDKARDLYTQAFDLAKEHYLYFRAECAANSLCGHALAQGDVAKAREWCEVCKEQSRLSKRESPYEETMSYEAEVCIRERKFEEAQALIHKLRPFAKRLNSTRSRARELALQAHLKLSSGEPMSQRDCQEMLLHYPKVARAFRMDYYVAQLVRGLASMKRKNEATVIFLNYLSQDRRSHAPLSVDLVQIQKKELYLWSSKNEGAIDDPIDKTSQKKKPRA